MTAVTLNAATVTRYRKNPDSFVDECLINPETGKPFDLYEAERVFVRCAFQLNKHGRLLFPLLMFCAIKKSGKTVFGAIFVLTLMVLFAERFAEAFCCANDLEQSKSRVFEMCVRIVKASPLLKRATRILSQKIEFTGTGATIVPIAGDYTGAAGAHPSITVFDELWGFEADAALAMMPAVGTTEDFDVVTGIWDEWRQKLVRLLDDPTVELQEKI